MKKIISTLSFLLLSYQIYAVCYQVNSLVSTNITSTQATLNWVPAAGSLSFSSVYRILGSPSWISGPGPLGGTTYSQTLSGLQPASTYEYGLQTQCAALQTSTLRIIQFTTLPACNAPSGLSSTSILYTTATINWSAVSGSQNYTVQYKANSSATWLTVSTATTSTSFGLSGLTQATLYDYRVKTNCSGGSSAYAQGQFTTLTLPCPTPSALFASGITSTQATITWNGGVGSLTHTLEYKANSSSVWITAIATTTLSTFTLTGLSNSTLYDFRVKANCSGSVSTYSQSQFTTSAPSCASPMGLSSSGITSSGASVSWNAVAGAITYQLEFKTASSTIWLPVVAATTTTTYTWVSGLTPSTAYDFRVKANCSSSFTQGQFTTLSLPCTPPNGLLASSITASTATLSWNAVAGATDYALGYKENTGAPWIWNILPGGTTSFNINGLTPSTVYDFQVATYCIGGASSSYTQAQFITTASTCPMPTNLNTTIFSLNSATFNWNAIAGAVSYTIRYRVVGGTVLWSNAVTSLTNSYTVNNLQYNTYYEWQVQTVCASGFQSAFTISSFFITLPCIPPAGSSMLNPILIGQAPCSANAFINTQNTAVPNCFSNNLVAIDNQVSPDIWYQFTLSNSATVEISHCGGFTNSMNTYVHLLNNAGIQLASNDDNGPLCLGNKASLSITLSPGMYYVVSEGNGGYVGSITTSIKTTDPCNSILQLTLFIEGYYASGSAMTTAMINQGFLGFPPAAYNDVDDIEVELRDAIFPYPIVGSLVTRLKTNGSAVCTFPVTIGNFYIVIKHRNAIQTWSKFPVSIGAGINTYNFSNSSSKAYGDNMKQVEPNVWALYAGDLNQDENIDLMDLSILDFDILIFQYGFVATDINGDGNVDLLDIPVVLDNVNNFIYANRP